MLPSRNHRPSRPAFTLVELLIVIAIIAVLVGLLLAAVVAVLDVRDRTQTQYEVQKMTESLRTAMSTFPGRPTYLPSQLILYNNLATYNSPPPTDNVTLVNQSRTALRQIFGQRLFTSGNVVNWSPNPSSILQGHQCLVFYLGGATTTSPASCLGFSNNPTNPMAAGGQRIGPFFEFKTTRLNTEANGFFSYLDPYGKQYAYFSTAGSDNNYTNITPGDCINLGITSPYFVTGSSPNQFLNASSFQIISAGKNNAFGLGGAWDPANGSTDPATRDNVTNFSRTQLGNPQN